MTDDFARLSALLDELFDLDDAERAKRLGQIAAEDAALAIELRRLLAADQRSGVLDAGVVRAAPTVMSNLAADDADTSAPKAEGGKRLGHYRLVERVGSGGMGEVWRGERVDDFEQAVAIKLIRPLIDSPQLRERFARERRILARLEHPNIARLLDGGVSEDGTPWYAMEFVRGDNISHYADAQALDARARVELLLQVVDAVAHAQALLVVHRDLKPSNILVDAQGRTRVLDFGIARLLDEASDMKLTGTGVRVFSPAYAAPEQIRGDAVGTAADVFALGAVLYELLTGQVPHPKRSAAPDRLIAGLEHETAPRASEALRAAAGSTHGARTTRQARELVGDLDTIVATALQPEPGRRYAGAAQLGDDLRRWLDGRPIAAQSDTAGYRMRKFVTRHRIAVGGASAVLLALIAGLGLALWQASVARNHANRADAEAQRANIEAQRAEHEATQAKAQVGRTRKVKEFLVSVFTQADPMRRSTDSPVSLSEAFDATLKRAETELAGDPVLQADVFDDFGEIRANQGRFDEALVLFEKAIAVAEKEYGPEHPALAESLVNFSVVNTMSRNAAAGAAQMERAVAILEKNDGGEPLALANALGGLSAVRQQQGRIEESAQLARRNLVVARRHRAPDDMELAVVITNVAIHDANEERNAEAEAGFREAMAIVEKQQGPDSPHLWANLSNLALVFYSQGNLAEEVRAYERALAIARNTFPSDHPWIAESLIDLGWTRARDGKHDEGEKMILEGVAMFEQLGSPRVITGLRRLGAVQRRRGDNTAALTTFNRGWENCQANEPHEQHCVVLRANRAQMLALVGQGEEALSEAEAAVAELAPRAPGLVSERAQTLQAKAAALAALNRKDEARVVQDQAIALLEKTFGPEHAETRGAAAAGKTLR